MKMNRRNVLVGLGTVVAGGGAALGTGAFSSVEAQRSVTVNVDGDDSALLALDPSGDGTGSDVVQLQDGLLVIDFNAAGESSEGVNLEALTTVGDVDLTTDPVTVNTEAFTITNNASQSVDITFDINFDSDQLSSASSSLTEGNEDDILKLWTDPGAGSITNNNSGNLVSETLTLDPGNTATVALQIDTTTYDESNIDTTHPLFNSDATITAEPSTQ